MASLKNSEIENSSTRPIIDDKVAILAEINNTNVRSFKKTGTEVTNPLYKAKTQLNKVQKMVDTVSNFK